MQWTDLADQVTDIFNESEYNLLDESEAKNFDELLDLLQSLSDYLESYGEYLHEHAWDI